MFWKVNARCFHWFPDIQIATDNMTRYAVSGSLTKHIFTDVCDLMVLISVDNLGKYNYDSALATFSSNTL